jgi:hypothetical protein
MEKGRLAERQFVSLQSTSPCSHGLHWRQRQALDEAKARALRAINCVPLAIIVDVRPRCSRGVLRCQLWSSFPPGARALAQPGCRRRVPSKTTGAMVAIISPYSTPSNPTDIRESGGHNGAAASTKDQPQLPQEFGAASSKEWRCHLASYALVVKPALCTGRPAVSSLTSAVQNAHNAWASRESCSGTPGTGGPRGGRRLRDVGPVHLREEQKTRAQQSDNNVVRGPCTED